MKRPILVAVIGYIIGILWGLYIEISIVPLILILIILYIVKSKYRKIILIISIFIILANIETIYLNNKYENLYKDVKEIDVVATVVSEEKETAYNYQYKIKVETINKNKKYKNTHLLLNIKKSDKAKKLEYGDKIVFVGEYIEPSISRNYKGFDYKEYLKTVKVYGSVKAEANVKIINKNNANILNSFIYKIKAKIKTNVKECLQGETANLALGILLGDTDNITDELKDEFKTSSLYHILAVSGTHISYIIVGSTFILEKSKINKRTSRIIIIFILIFFMMLTGLSPSVVRAGIMGIILIGSRSFL